MLSSDVGECCLLVLLDLRAAFDTVDQSVLTERQKPGETFSVIVVLSVSLGPHITKTAALSCGVPQGPVSGPK